MKKKLAALTLTVAMITMSLAGCGNKAQQEATNAATSSKVDKENSTEVEDVSLKIWSPEDEFEITQTLCEEFASEHPEYNITWEYEIMENSDSITELKKDPDLVADVFVYPSGGVPELVQAGLVYPISVNLDTVKASYGESALKACSSEDILYGIPQTPNAFFMYYNKSLFDENEVKSLETMMGKELEKGTYNFSFAISNSWYMESFFYAAGGTLYGADGTDATECSWNNEDGYQVGKYLIDLANNKKYLEDVDNIASSKFEEGKLGAVCSGTWAAEEFKEALGDNLGACVLPTIQLNGTECQLSNFADYKAYGVKSSTAFPKQAQEVAEWLAGEHSQLARFEQLNMTPTVTSLLENEDVKANEVVSALAEMTALYSTPQPSTSQISEYWTPAAAFGSGIVNGDVTESNLQENLDAMVSGFTTKLADQ